MRQVVTDLSQSETQSVVIFSTDFVSCCHRLVSLSFGSAHSDSQGGFVIAHSARFCHFGFSCFCHFGFNCPNTTSDYQYHSYLWCPQVNQLRNISGSSFPRMKLWCHYQQLGFCLFPFLSLLSFLCVGQFMNVCCPVVVIIIVWFIVILCQYVHASSFSDQSLRCLISGIYIGCCLAKVNKKNV